MIDRAQLAALPPARRAQIIYAAAQSELQGRLWRAALGAERDDGRATVDFGGGTSSSTLLDLLVGTQATDRGLLAAAQPAAGPTPVELPDPPADPDPAAAGPGSACALGCNDRFGASIAAAEAATGVPAAAIAAIVDAESAKFADGSWNPRSRNPRSSAAGLGQFLSGTWQSLAQTRGTWLNATARANGWLDARGHVTAEARAPLLALRYDGNASIRTVADLARINLDRLERGGVKARLDLETTTKAAYLGHHLGIGDARRFLAGGLDSARAQTLLNAQVGTRSAQQRIAAAGDATQAHRQWLLSYISRNVRPQRFLG